MPVMDEFKEERKNLLKDGTPKEKFSYFWYYYKWHVIISIIIIIAAISLIHTYVTRKGVGFYAVMLNTGAYESAEAYSQEVSEALNIDTEKYEVLFDTTMYVDFNNMDDTTVASSQKMMVYIAAAEFDIIVTDTASLQHYAYTDTLYDLRDLLSKEQLEKYEPYFYYIDKNVLDEQAAASDAMDDSYVPEYPQDPSNPEDMAEPVPVGIYVDSCDDFTDNFYFRADDIVFSVVVTTTRPELAVKYLDYVFEKPQNSQ